MIGTTVRVHLNLHRGDWSISDRSTGKVLRSCDDVTLRNVRFHVSETTRQRIIAKQRRRVHAWAIGELVAVDSKPEVGGLTEVTYNPYRSADFTQRDGTPVTGAEIMYFVGRSGWTS